MGIVIGALFVFVARFSITFATNEALHPLLGVWLPNIVFGIVAVILFMKAQK